MADTPLTNLTLSFCTSLEDLVREIKGILGAYQSANNKLNHDSYNLVTKDAGAVSFYGMGASAFFGSVKRSVGETNLAMQTLTNLATAATRCHTSLNTASTNADISIQRAQHILDSYSADITGIYGDAAYPYIQLMDAIAGLDLNSVIQQGSSAIWSAFDDASLTMSETMTLWNNTGNPVLLQHSAGAATGVRELTEKIQSICLDWADQVHSDVTTFNQAALQPNYGLKLPSSSISTPLYKSSYTDIGKKGINEGENGTESRGKKATSKGSVSVPIGPYWQTSAPTKDNWQEAGTMGAVPVHNAGSVTALNAQAGVNIGREKDGTFDAGLTAGANMFDMSNQTVLGSPFFGFTLNEGITGPSAEAQAGLRQNSLGASIGASALTASGGAGVNIAGFNIGVTGGIGAKVELGFQIGAKTELKLPFITVGFTVGSAKSGTAK